MADQGVIPEPENESLNERVLDALALLPEKEFAADEIATSLNAKIPLVRAALSRMATQGRIVKKERGRYQYVKTSLTTESEATIAA